MEHPVFVCAVCTIMLSNDVHTCIGVFLICPRVGARTREAV